MIRPATFQSWTYRLPSLSQDEPWVPLKSPSIHLSCGDVVTPPVAGSGLLPSTAMIVLVLSKMTRRPCRSGTETKSPCTTAEVGIPKPVTTSSMNSPLRS